MSGNRKDALDDKSITLLNALMENNYPRFCENREIGLEGIETRTVSIVQFLILLLC